MTGTTASRGQSLPDFVVAMFVFLLTMGFIITFVPQITAPYEHQEGPVVVDRIADDITESVLADPTIAGGLDEPCTVALFHDDPTVDCAVDVESIEDRFDADDRYRVNVTMSSPGGEPVCVNRSSLTRCDETEADQVDAGPAVPDAGASVFSTRRVLHHGDDEVVIEVRAWRP